MRRRGLRGAGALLSALLLLPAAGCTPLDDAMVAIFGRSMRDQPSLDPYENPQPPAENTVPFASGNYPAGAYDVGLGQSEGTAAPPPPFEQRDLLGPGTDVVNTLENPVEATPESLERGRVLYERNCAVCHGESGIGAEAPLAPVHGMLPGFDLATGAATGFTDGYLYGIIRVGRGMMPAYGDRVTHFDRWHLVNYVRELQRGGGPAGEAASGEGSGADAGAEDEGSEGDGPDGGSADTAAGTGDDGGDTAAPGGRD